MKSTTSTVDTYRPLADELSQICSILQRCEAIERIEVVPRQNGEPGRWNAAILLARTVACEWEVDLIIRKRASGVQFAFIRRDYAPVSKSRINI